MPDGAYDSFSAFCSDCFLDFQLLSEAFAFEVELMDLLSHAEWDEAIYDSTVDTHRMYMREVERRGLLDDYREFRCFALDHELTGLSPATCEVQRYG